MHIGDAALAAGDLHLALQHYEDVKSIKSFYEQAHVCHRSFSEILLSQCCFCGPKNLFDCFGPNIKYVFFLEKIKTLKELLYI